jgi:transcriptional regulator with XRE-family HTH domain
MKKTETQKIGFFIKELRERRGLTQGEFAKKLATSQSAVARMEKVSRISALIYLVK